MQRLTEDEAKRRLRAAGVAVPEGAAAASAEAAAEAAARIGGSVVVKALVPAGRRGKAGAVRFAASPAEAADIAAALIGTEVGGHPCRAVYLEAKADIARELYLAFILDDHRPRVLLSLEGGVDIEEIHETAPERIVTADLDPVRGFPVWDAIARWEEAGLAGRELAAVAQLTSRLYAAFKGADATMLEVNPLAILASGEAVAVGAMMAVEDPLLADLSGAEANEALGGRPLNERERRVLEANASLPGGMIRYTELDGDIGLWVGGGGAGLVQHDMILARGGRPANHTDASTVNPDKVRVLVDAILDNPNVRSLFVSWHYQQMARIEKRVVPVIEALKARRIDVARFPVVIRMFGPGEDDARRAAAELPGVHYMPHGAPMSVGVDLIVALTRQAAGRAA